MLLRHLVGQWARQAATQRVMELAADMRQGDKDRPPPPTCPIVVVFATGVESGGFVDSLSQLVTTRCRAFVEHTGLLNGQRVAILETGIGTGAVSEAVTDAVQYHQPAWVVSAGFACGLVPHLRRGHILMADHLIADGGERYDVGLQIDETASASLHSGRLFTTHELIRHPKQRVDLANKHDAVACDMEAAHVAAVCRQHRIRFLAVHIISEALDDELPPEMARLLEQPSFASKLGAATGALFQRPSSVKDMWKLKEDGLKASDRLARFLRSTLDQLAAS